MIKSGTVKRNAVITPYVVCMTHLGPPHSIAEALTMGSAVMATGSIVKELFSTAL